MKLRSGKIIGKKELPAVLQKKLDDTLLDFKELFASHQKEAIEVLKIIAEAKGFNAVYYIDDMLANTAAEDCKQSAGMTYTSLTGLVIGNHNIYPEYNIDHIYHDEIRDKILTFAEMSLAGEQ